ncbi:hypothetical protein HHL11_08030 [Ramlibacter sp. G-1-2-2]|uniref:Uncharacterized protein n=1 Tax=Ramlibacter agri TaxID=2728837 RepID=A0A848H510_9BURK|nr:hypothetical protein [Ramlibacter agri]NML43693.1 hypothetical protein [Ramlibacter agri]
MTAIPVNANEVSPLEQERSRAWAFALLALACAQMLAFWAVCSHQVRKAEVRSNEVVVQQMALSDCLQYIPGSTIASCTSQLDAAKAPAPAANTAVSGATPVSFTR